MRAEVSAAATYNDAFDRDSADGAGLACAHVDAMFELEKAADAICIDVIGDGRSAEFNGVLENFDEGGA